jgi:uncharacterized integral membrane protein
MAFGYLLVALVAAAVAVFALQNGEPTPVRFLVWSSETLPLAALILAALAGGLVVAGLPLLFRGWRLRSRLRAAERRIAELEQRAAAPPKEPPVAPPAPPPPPALPG